MPNRIMIKINTSSVRENVFLWVCIHLPPCLAPAVTQHPCSPAPDIFRWRSTMRQVFAPSTAEQSPIIRCSTKETAVPRRIIVPCLSLSSLRTARVSAALPSACTLRFLSPCKLPLHTQHHRHSQAEHATHPGRGLFRHALCAYAPFSTRRFSRQASLPAAARRWSEAVLLTS